MKTITILLTTMLIGMAAACHSADTASRKNAEKSPVIAGDVVIKKNSLEPFTSLDCSLAIDITYTQDSNSGIELEIPQNITDRIEYEVRNKCLYIRHKKEAGSFSLQHGKIRCRITSPELQEIDLHGAARFTTSTPIKSDHFQLNCHGASKIRIPSLSCTTFEADVHGASQADLTIGKATQARIKNSGASTLNVSIQAQNTRIYNSGAGKIQGDLTSEQISLENSGAGTFTVKVDCKKLTGRNSGAGKCRISGTADDVNLDNSGASRFDVSKLNQ